jgi:hypothetical protein
VRVIISIIVLSIGSTTLFAQDVITSSGGKATGVNGTINFSVGQLFYAPVSAPSGSLTPGMQQQFTVSLVTDIAELLEKEDMLSVYPNPTLNFITIRVDHSKDIVLDFKLYNLNGSVVMSGHLTEAHTDIVVQHVQPAIYLLKVFNGSVNVKTFRIIKY